MSVRAARVSLIDSAKTLKVRWQRARRDWRDEVARGFEERYLVELERALTGAAGAMAGMSEILDAVRRDCGDDESEAL